MDKVQVNTQGGAANIAPKAKRKSRKLTWNERQYGAGFIHGLWCGIALGLPIAAGVATLCHYFVGWLIG